MAIYQLVVFVETFTQDAQSTADVGQSSGDSAEIEINGQVPGLVRIEVELGGA